MNGQDDARVLARRHRDGRPISPRQAQLETVGKMAPVPDSTLSGYDFLRERVDASLDLLSEGRNLDFKESKPYDVLKYKIIKAALAMSNVRSGGLVVVGVSERHSEWSLDGISDADLATYDVDVILDQVHVYASLEVGIDVVKHVRDGKTYLIINIREFQSDIVICRKNGPQGEAIEKGRVYTRPPGKAQSRAVETSEEMREITDLAAEKKARQMIAASERIGMVASPGVQEKFEEELGDL
jgi:Putative DNA-binding domain